MAERDALLSLARQAEEATRRSAEAQSSVNLRVQMLESNMRLLEAYDNASTPTRDMMEGAVIERNRRRHNILHGHLDRNGRPLDVDTDEEADDEVRQDLLAEGFVRLDVHSREAWQRAWSTRRALYAPWRFRFAAPEPFVPLEPRDDPTELASEAESSSVYETVEGEDESETLAVSTESRRYDLMASLLRREVEASTSPQSPRGLGTRSHGTELLMHDIVSSDQSPTAAVVPQEGDEEPVWYYRRAREVALEDAERLQEDIPDGDLQATEWEGQQVLRVNDADGASAHLDALAYNRVAQQAESTEQASSNWLRKSVRTDLKALLQNVQQKLEAEQDRAAAGQLFSEGSYLELSDLLRDMYLCVERI